MRTRFAFGQSSAPSRRKAALALYLVLCVLGLGVSANAQDRKCKPTIVTFEAPESGTGLNQGTRALDINPAGAITGFTRDASDVRHGFLRARDCTFTMFDVPGAGTGSNQGTRAYGISPAGEIAGWYSDESGVVHGYLRRPTVASPRSMCLVRAAPEPGPTREP